MSDWWHLPGPSRLLDVMERDLRAGLSLLIQMPPTSPVGLRDSLGARVRSNDLWMWRQLDWAERENNETPAEFLVRRLTADICPWADGASFARAPSACGIVAWVQGLKPEDWRAWTQFVEDFDHAVRDAPNDHPVVVLPLDGELACERIPAYAVARLHAMREWIDRYDVAGFVWNRMRDRSLHPLHKMVATAMCVELSGTDTCLAERLCVADLNRLFAPFQIIAELARERGWSGPAPHGWSTGADEYWDNRMRRTSCASASEADHAEITRRVWRAQIGVLFPFIEEQRVRLLRELRPYWRVPFNTRFGVIQEIEGLEVTHMSMLAQENGAPRSIVRLLERLSAMRHSLAHLTPIELRVLEDTELLQPNH